MTKQDQLAELPTGLRVFASSRLDGTMLDRTLGNTHAPSTVANREQFCRKVGIDYQETVYLTITYGDARTYDAIRQVVSPDTGGVEVDVLYTEMPCSCQSLTASQP